ncbi:hypothetical protein [Burkholderia gladioli]|uniref:hypothetical protein n=1 Tax=Burkholderia gladioli TaxID=28095 RepID=UPI001FC8654C|nr:hypothetical protein [Burkholderia gladioli]
MTTEHKKIPAQGGEMPPVERAAITGSRGAHTVPVATPAGNAAQRRAADLTNGQILTIAKHHFRADHSTTPETLDAYCESVRAVITAYALDAPQSALSSRLRIREEERDGNWYEFSVNDHGGMIRVVARMEDDEHDLKLGQLVRNFLLNIPSSTQSAEYDGNHVQDHCCECDDYEAECRCAEPVPSRAASGLPAWFDTFLTRVCEIPDRNSPDGEPDAIVATLGELKHCALNAIEECAGDVPATADDHAARLDDADIDTIAESMPGGLGSFMKQWGWRQFARAIEDEVVLNGSRVQRAASGQSFQARVQPWMLECFGPTIAADTIERNHRFLEEALELVQSLGCTASEAHQLVDYTFGRPIGEPAQEVGGVMVTLAALCLASGLDMHQAAETELARISEPAMVLKIRAKQAAKPKHSPLPQAVAARAPYEWRDTGPLETNEGGAA